MMKLIAVLVAAVAAALGIVTDIEHFTLIEGTRCVDATVDEAVAGGYAEDDICVVLPDGTIGPLSDR